MKKLYKHTLHFNTTYSYVRDNLKNVNLLSDEILKTVNFQNGSFFTLFPPGTDLEKIHNFTQGGIAKHLNKKIIEFLKQNLLSNSEYSLIFDDVIESREELLNFSLFQSNGFCYKDEVYYVVPHKTNVKTKLIQECLQASDVIWHCLAILTKSNFSKEKEKSFNDEIIFEICKKTELIMTTAYDGEGYVFWEPKNRMKEKDD